MFLYIVPRQALNSVVLIGVDENTTADSDRLVRLPMYYNIKNDDLNKVIEKTLEFFNSETK